MKILLTYLYIIFFVFCSTISFAQNKYIDSLKLELKKSTISTKIKFDLLNKLAEYHRTSDQYKQADYYINEQVKLSKRENNELELVKAYTQRGVSYENRQWFEKAQKSLDTIQNITKDSKEFLPKAYQKYLLAYHYVNLGEFEKSQKMVLQFITQLEKTPDEYILKSKANYLLYAVHATWNDAKNSILYAEKSLKFAELSSDKNLLVTTYANLGVAQSLKYMESKNSNDLDELIKTSKKAVQISEHYQNQVTNYNYAIALLNLADYQRNYTKLTTNDKNEIKQNSFKIIELCKTIPNSQEISAGALGLLSSLAKEENQIELAEKYLLDANAILYTQTVKNFYALVANSTELANLYQQKGEFQKAFEFQKKATDYSTELYNQDQAEAAKKLEAQFQSERKEEELKNLEAKNKSLQKERILYICLAVLGIIGAFFMFRSYHFKLRYSIGRENQLNSEKHEANLKLQLQEEEQARILAEQELMTLQQQKLQDEVLASQLHLEHKNQVLKNLKDKIGNESSINLKQVMREENLLDNDFESAKFRIQELHPNFFKTLNEHSKQKLTPLDLKYCSYIYLGLDTKQIATILNIEPKSVRMTKYRLKQKFSLVKEDELYTFFHQIIA